MIKKLSYRHIDWIDLERPSHEDIAGLLTRYNLHEKIAEELTSPSVKPHTEFLNNAIFLVLRFPSYDEKTGGLAPREIDFVIGKHFFLTAHYEPVRELSEFSKIFEHENILKQHDPKVHSGFIFFYIMKNLYRSLLDELEDIKIELEEIEQGIFSGEEHKMVKRLSVVGRRLVDFRKYLKEHDGALLSFANDAKEIFGDVFARYTETLSNEYQRLWDTSESIRDIFHELRATNDSLLTTKTNDIIKVLTIMAFVTYPLALIAAIFGMNTHNAPLIGTQYDFWAIIGIMALFGAIFFSVFKYKRWL